MCRVLHGPRAARAGRARLKSFVFSDEIETAAIYISTE
jgi:hypothetical protein